MVARVKLDQKLELFGPISLFELREALELIADWPGESVIDVDKSQYYDQRDSGHVTLVIKKRDGVVHPAKT